MSPTSSPDTILSELNKQFDAPVGTGQFKTLRPRKLYSKDIVTRATSSSGLSMYDVVGLLVVVLLLGIMVWVFIGGLNPSSQSSAGHTTSTPTNDSILNGFSFLLGTIIPLVSIGAVGLFFLSLTGVFNRYY